MLVSNSFSVLFHRCCRVSIRTTSSSGTVGLVARVDSRYYGIRVSLRGETSSERDGRVSRTDDVAVH